MTIDRRDFMMGAVVAAGGAVLAPAMSTISSAHAQPAAPSKAQAPGWYRTKVGDITVTTILDGSMEMPNDLFTQASPEMIKDAREQYFLPKDGPFPAYINAFLIQTGGKNILIDTGAQGFGPTMGRTKGTLAALGVGADAVDEIILSHAHPDHANGLLDEKGGIAFKNAALKICETDVNFWYDDAAMAKYEAKKMMFDTARKNLGPYKASGQLKTFKFDSDLGNGLSSVALPGHTPGHTGVMVSQGKEQLLIWGDIVHNAFLQFDHPEQTLAYDLDAETAAATRAKIFDRVATDRLRIAGMHLPFNAIGHLAKRGGGYHFVPQRWEADI
jgi:glyoxylase-like metal-dependent hydrolase (beta-lactamase superfamily II)